MASFKSWERLHFWRHFWNPATQKPTLCSQSLIKVIDRAAGIPSPRCPPLLCCVCVMYKWRNGTFSRVAITTPCTFRRYSILMENNQNWVKLTLMEKRHYGSYTSLGSGCWGHCDRLKHSFLLHSPDFSPVPKSWATLISSYSAMKIWNRSIFF